MNWCCDTSHHHAEPVRAGDQSEYLCLAQSLPEGLTGLEKRAHTGGHLCVICLCVGVWVRERQRWPHKSCHMLAVNIDKVM